MTDSEVSILIVDDDEIDTRAVERALRQQRIVNPVYRAGNGQEGLAMLRGEGGRQKVPRPYLILLDLNMPRMNGLQFLQELRGDSSLSDSIVFVLTSSRRRRQGRCLRATYRGIPGEARYRQWVPAGRADARAVRVERPVSAVSRRTGEPWSTALTDPKSAC